jgi:mycothiol synthase
VKPAVPAAASGPVGQWRADAVPAEAVAELNARAIATDGVAPLSGHVIGVIVRPPVDGAGDAAATDSGLAWLPATSPDGDLPTAAPTTLPGLAVAVHTDPAEVVVDPAARGRGLGTALVRAAIARQGAVWAYGDLPAAARVAQRLGLVRGRVLLQLRRHRDAGAAVPPPTLPAGITLRTFIPGRDEAAFLGVNARAFAWHPEQGRLDLAGLQAEMAQPWFDPAGFFLAVRGEEVIGFHWTKVHPVDPTPAGAAPAPAADHGPPGGGGAGGPTADTSAADTSAADASWAAAPGGRDPIGEVYVIGVDPDAGVRGLGTPLTAAGLRHLEDRGIGTVMLYVEGDNEKALRLYEQFGFAPHLANVVYSTPVEPAEPGG